MSTEKESGLAVNIFKSILIAFSIYSRIPMPTFEWSDADYRHSISFLPLVGAVIGILVGVATIFEDLPVFVLTAIFSVIPLIVTGGFHLDGFMDVYDAKSSFSEKEKSLEIMKDPHIGAFATIGLLKLMIIWAGALYLVVYGWKTGRHIGGVYSYAASFMTVRALCGLISIILPKAKSDGMLVREAGAAAIKDKVILGAELIIAVTAWAYVDWMSAICCGAGLFAFSTYYYLMCKKRFGGVTGDTAGYYVVMSELVVVVILAVIGTAYWL